ncbi:MAG: DinB family protein [Cyclobacteriaceae bacterium]|nr:DinB family protein [Cyclobacteriaceae bacterium]
MTYNSKDLLADLQTQTEALLNRAIAEWQLVPHSKLALKPNTQAWSANECLQHLNSYGRYYLPAIEKALRVSGQKKSDTFTTGWLGNYFTNLMAPKASGAITKMKSPSDHTPTAIRESHEVIAEYIDQQEKLLSLLRKAATTDLTTRVPISLTRLIRLKLGDVFMFYVAHLQRHSLQAERALQQAGFLREFS